jgi:site-specific DNA-methyltransferase (adenine-specific)
MLNTIIHGNSIKVIEALADNYIDAIISDIPYGISYNEWDVLHSNTNTALGGSSSAQTRAGGVFKRRGKPLNGWSNSDKKIPLEYQHWCASWAPDWLRVLKPGASCLIFAGRRYAHRCICALEDSGFTFKDILAWEKATAPHRAQRVSEIYRRRGNYEAQNRWQGWRVGNMRPLFEPILWFQKPYKTGATLADNILDYDVGAWNSEIAQSNIMRINSDKSDRGLHETQKPLKLIELLVALVTTEGSVILDPFAGSGTTCLAAKNLGRHYIGIEIDEKYAAIAAKRLTDA